MLTEGADYEGVSRATVTLPRRFRVWNVAVALAVVPGFLYGISWLVLGGYAGDSQWTRVFIRLLGAVLAAAALNAAWHLARSTRLAQAFLCYVGCFVAVLALLWLSLGR